MDIKESQFSLEGKTILVTGASSGIGRQCAVTASQFGAKVVICGRNAERLEETMSTLCGVGHTSFIGDLTDNEVLQKLVSYVGKIDGAVFAAGKLIPKPFNFTTPSVLRDLFDINFFSQYELLRLLSKSKSLNKESSIVFISSIGGCTDFVVGDSAYGTSKAALNSMVKYCSLELSQRKVRVNAVCPGIIETPLTKELMDTIPHDDLLKPITLKRLGQPSDVANCVLYLLSSASSWVTGQSFNIDGGTSL